LRPRDLGLAGSDAAGLHGWPPERRGEVLDVGLSRLREAATAEPLALDDLAELLARDLASDGHHDDRPILGVRWRE
jgi:hypothetical protein